MPDLSNVELIARQLLGGLWISVQIFVLTLVFTFPFGLVVALGRMSRNAVLRNVTRIYVSVMRGTPLMLQLLVVFFGPYYLFGVSLKNYPPFVAVIVAFVLNYSAYFAEIYRAGITSIPVGQYEAATVLGYTKAQTFFKIILPQVIKRIVPPVTNEVITLVKDTSLAQVLAVQEMFTIAKQLANAQSSMVALVVAGVFYYVFNFVVALVMERIEARLDYYR
ncbi:MAG: amino acid ABC transporter permease [Oligosphaeraceae bacterium]